MSPVSLPPPGSFLSFPSFARFSADSLLSPSPHFLVYAIKGSTRPEPLEASPTPSFFKETNTPPSSRSTPMDTSSVSSILTMLLPSRSGMFLSLFPFRLHHPLELSLTFPLLSSLVRTAPPSATRSSTTPSRRTTPTSTRCLLSSTPPITMATLERPPWQTMMSLRSFPTLMMLLSLMRCELGLRGLSFSPR